MQENEPINTPAKNLLLMYSNLSVHTQPKRSRWKHWHAATVFLLTICSAACVSAWAQTPGTHEMTAKPPENTDPERQQVSYGTGFSISKGYILTAYHVVKDIPKVLIGSAAMGKWTVSEVVKTDPVLDLALIKTSLDLPVLSIARSDQVPIGLEITVIGYPQPRIQGLTPKITQGIINGYPNLKQQAEDRGYFQISAEVSRGNSGGPLLGPDGTVIGMIQRKLDTQRVMDRTQEWTVNISYALRSSHLLGFLNGTQAIADLRQLDTQQLLRPYQIYERATPGVVSIIARQLNLAPKITRPSTP